ncbi:hypothetical protein KUTeg_023872, partial [Tegillarca granosa]
EIKENEIITKTDVNGTVHKLLCVNGHYIATSWAERGFLPDPRISLPEIRDMEMRPDDILVCAYAKAGTHWLWEITKMLIKRSAEYEPLPKESVMLEFHLPEDFDDLESPRVLNTHLNLNQLPKQTLQKNSKIIHIQRNPKDVAVSLFCHRSHANLHVTKEWEQFLRVFETETDCLTKWFSYTLEWERKIDENKDLQILQLYYEDIKKNPVKEIQRLANFLEVDCDEVLAEHIADKCSFKNLKKANNEIKIDILNRNPEEKSDVAKSDFLYRKGEIGDWKNWFTVAQNERFNQSYKEWMKTSKLKFTYI